MAATNEISADSPRRWQFGAGLVAALLLGLAVIYVLGYQAYSRSFWLRESDEANLREWLDESKVFRKSLPELVQEYVEFRDRYQTEDDDALSSIKREEIAEQLKRLADPTRLYQGQMPLFPEIYLLEVAFPGTRWRPIFWRSPLPRSAAHLDSISRIEYPMLGESESRVRFRCEFRLHAFNARQREAEEARRRWLYVIAGATTLFLLMIGGAYVAWRWYKARENEALEEKLRRQEAERKKIEIESQMYASIGVAAGSYAHNVKNLLVRPNDLIARCLDAEGLPSQHRGMLNEVRATLATVNERLQQILSTVRRDPTQALTEHIDLNRLAWKLVDSWRDVARDKWKLDLAVETVAAELFVDGNESNLTQAVENLLFNARDATFEMRNALRDEAHSHPTIEPRARQQALLDAAAWRGRIVVRTGTDNRRPVLEVVDNGVGMTLEVQKRATETYFSTKRDNALFEGWNAGSGVGLSFAAKVLEQHGARLLIESAPRAGATFRVIFAG